MKTIDMNIIKSDLLGEKKDVFLVEFPELELEAKELIKKPACGTCINNYFSKLYSLKDFNERLKLIYGDEIKINTKITLSNPSGLTQVQEIYDVPVDGWDEWFKRQCKLTATYQIRLMNTFFNPHTNMVKVSIIAMKQV